MLHTYWTYIRSLAITIPQGTSLEISSNPCYWLDWRRDFNTIRSITEVHHGYKFILEAKYASTETLNSLKNSYILRVSPIYWHQNFIGTACCSIVHWDNLSNTLLASLQMVFRTKGEVDTSLIIRDVMTAWVATYWSKEEEKGYETWRREIALAGGGPTIGRVESVNWGDSDYQWQFSRWLDRGIDVSRFKFQAGRSLEACWQGRECERRQR